MALITSAQTGNFDDGATWTGGVVPTVGDEARASNGHTITINVNTTCDEVSNAGTGIFTLNDGITLTANVTSKSTTTSRNCLQFTAVTPASATIVGNCTGGTVSSAVAVANTSSGTLTITGNCTSGSGNNAHGANNTSTGTLTITGNCTGGSGSSADGVRNNSTGTINITGNCTGGSSGSAHGANNNSTGTINITGNCTGGSAGVGANNPSTGTLTITGNCTGGSGSSAYGANNPSTGTLRCIKAIGNGFGNGSVGLSAAVGVSSAQNSLTEVEEIEYGDLGMSPTTGPVSMKNLTTNKAIVYRPSLSKKTLVDSSTAGDYPANSDVRSGTVFNFSNNTGTLAVPAANQVAVGVAVDNTTGTAVLTAQNIRDAVGLASANLDTQLAGISVDLTPVLNRLPAALVSGRIDASVGAMAANTLTASALASDAIDEIIIGISGWQPSWAGGNDFEAVLQQISDDAAQINDVEADTQNIQSRIPTALVGGRMDSSVGAMAANTLTASALASDAAAEIADAVYDEPYAGHTTPGTYGFLWDKWRKSNPAITGEVTSAVTPTTTTFSTDITGYADTAFDNAVLVFINGSTNADFRGVVSGYLQANGQVTITPALPQAPVIGDEFTIAIPSFVYTLAQVQSGLATSAGVTSAFTEIKGAGWSSATDTLEKIRDAVGAGGGGTIIQTPIVGIVPERDSQTLLRVYRGETVEQEVHVFEGDGETPIDLSGKTLEIVFEAYLTEDVVVISNANIDVSGDDNNVVTFDYPSTLTATTGKRFWSLREATSPYTVYLNGEVHILRAAVEDV